MDRVCEWSSTVMLVIYARGMLGLRVPETSIKDPEMFVYPAV